MRSHLTASLTPSLTSSRQASTPSVISNPTISHGLSPTFPVDGLAAQRAVLERFRGYCIQCIWDHNGIGPPAGREHGYSEHWGQETVARWHSWREPVKCSVKITSRGKCWTCWCPDKLYGKTHAFNDIVLETIFIHWHDADRHRSMLVAFPDAPRTDVGFQTWLPRADPLTGPNNAWRVFYHPARQLVSVSLQGPDGGSRMSHLTTTKSVVFVAMGCLFVSRSKSNLCTLSPFSLSLDLLDRDRE